MRRPTLTTTRPLRVVPLAALHARVPMPVAAGAIGTMPRGIMMPLDDRGAHGQTDRQIDGPIIGIVSAPLPAAFRQRRGSGFGQARMGRMCSEGGGRGRFD
eukprot:scaffold3296_cov405-Prasinococcus_capsulatus_cf.AAC.15